MEDGQALDYVSPTASESVSAQKGRFVGSKQIWGAFGLGVFLVAGGFAIEEWVPRLFPNLVGPDALAPHNLTLLELVVLFFKEIGLAFIVAAIIGWAVEKRAKERDNERADRLRREVAHDAIFSIYGLRHRTDFINAAVETNLHARVVRENMAMNYEVRPPTKDEADLILPGGAEDVLQRFVVLEMTLTYTFRNVASKEEEFTIPYTIPLRQGEGARKLTRANYVCFDGTALAEAEIVGAGKAKAEELVYNWTRKLAPGRTLDVVIAAQCLKERSDAEVWGCLFPTMGDLTLSLKVPDGLHFGVRDHSNATVVEKPGKPSATAKTWSMSGPLLTHNSIIFWWRIPEDDAKDESSPPAEFSEEKPPVVSEAVAKEPTRGWRSWFRRP